MTYRDRVILHLSMYRKSTLNVEKPGLFRYRGTLYEKEHILPADDSFKRLNILEPYRDKFYASKLSRISIHRYFHHLNSSQAMCINLFYPLIDENLLYLIPKYLNISELNIQDQAFEKESPIEMVTGNQRKTENKTLFALYG